MPEYQPRERKLGMATGGDGAAPPYVRLTQRGRPPHERRSVWILLAAVVFVVSVLLIVVTLVAAS